MTRLCDNHEFQEIAACLEQLIVAESEQDRLDAIREGRAALLAVGVPLPLPGAPIEPAKPRAKPSRKKPYKAKQFPCNQCGSQGKLHTTKCPRNPRKPQSNAQQ